MRRIGSKTVVLSVILVILLVLFAYAVLTYTRRVSGTSMLPTFEEGDLVVVVNVPSSSIHVGDVIVYNPPCSAVGESVIHRVVSVTSDGGFITKGDNNGATDQEAGIAASPIYQNCLVGKVVFVIPYLERIASLPYGANYLIAALIIVIVLVSEFYPRGSREVGEEQTDRQVTSQPPNTSS
jgi:signal peptidase